MGRFKIWQYVVFWNPEMFRLISFKKKFKKGKGANMQHIIKCKASMHDTSEVFTPSKKSLMWSLWHFSSWPLCLSSVSGFGEIMFLLSHFNYKLCWTQCKCTGQTCCNIQWTYVCLSWSCSAHMHILHNKTTNARWFKLVGFVMSNCKCPGIFAFGVYYLFNELFLWQHFYLNLTSVFFICFLFNFSISHKIPCVNA